MIWRWIVSWAVERIIIQNIKENHLHGVYFLFTMLHLGYAYPKQLKSAPVRSASVKITEMSFCAILWTLKIALIEPHARADNSHSRMSVGRRTMATHKANTHPTAPCRPLRRPAEAATPKSTWQLQLQMRFTALTMHTEAVAGVGEAGCPLEAVKGWSAEGVQGATVCKLSSECGLGIGFMSLAPQWRCILHCSANLGVWRKRKQACPSRTKSPPPSTTPAQHHLLRPALDYYGIRKLTLKIN